MAEIEVGEYVRTNTGLILKYDDENEKTFIDNFLTCPQIMKERIVNHSKQLIDLIEVGDVLEIRTGLYSSFKYFVENEDNLLLLEEQVKQFWNIETILTKEIYMANCYKVGGEKC